MFASSPERGSFLRGVLALSVKPCRACQLSQRESPWQCGKVSGSSAKFAGVSAPPGGAVAQRLRGFKSAEPEKTVKRSSVFSGVAHFFRIVKGVQPLTRCGVGGVQRWGGGSRNTPPCLWPSGASLRACGKQKLPPRSAAHFSGSLLVSKENIPRQAETSLAETILNLPTQKAAAAPKVQRLLCLFMLGYQPFRKAGRGLPSVSHW